MTLLTQAQTHRPHDLAGFAVVLGNPPWERVKLQEQEFFASRSDEIATAPNSAARKKLIGELAAKNPQLLQAWLAASRRAEGESHFARASGRFPLCGKGDVNTYALFAELNRTVVSDSGAVGCIVPAGIATDDTTKEYFQDVVDTGTLSALYHFENEERVFVGVNNMFRFVLLTITGRGRTKAAADIVAFARSAAVVSDPGRRYRISGNEIALLNPNSRTLPPFLSRQDADINLAMYRTAGILVRDSESSGNPWSVEVSTRLWHMAEDAALFLTGDQLRECRRHVSRDGLCELVVAHVPLLEGKMLHHFDHRFGTYEGATQANLNKGTLPQSTVSQHQDPDFLVTPMYWVPKSAVEDRLGSRQHSWLIAWRDITNAHNERTVVASVVPRAAVAHTAPLLFPYADPRLIGALYANLCAFALDYAARQKVGGTHLTYNYLKQLPVLVPASYGSETTWDPSVTVVDWLLPRVLELTYTAWDLQPFAQDVGYDGPPFRWDPARRFLLRAELDAAFFHLYGLNRDDTAYIMDTFPIVRKNDEKAHGEYRTKRVILEIYDEMAEAVRTGVAYRTRLVPRAGDPSVAHVGPSRHLGGGLPHEAGVA